MLKHVKALLRADSHEIQDDCLAYCMYVYVHCIGPYMRFGDTALAAGECRITLLANRKQEPCCRQETGRSCVNVDKQSQWGTSYGRCSDRKRKLKFSTTALRTLI